MSENETALSVPGNGPQSESVFDSQGEKTGLVHCMNCKAQWKARAPADTNVLECPECGLMRGTWYMPFMNVSREHWACECGNDLFRITADEIYCPNCGKEQEFRPHS